MKLRAICSTIIGSRTWVKIEKKVNKKRLQMQPLVGAEGFEPPTLCL
jgi:hypothetical protein